MSAEPKSAPSEVGSSCPKKKRRTIEELAADWGMLVEDARNYSAEYIVALLNIATEHQDAEVIKKVAAKEGREASQRKTLFHFEEEAVKKKKIGSILYRMDDKRFAGVQNRRFNPDPHDEVQVYKSKERQDFNSAHHAKWSLAKIH